jgi:predicted acyltransferase
MRLKSLDVFRGLTVAVMIFVNVAGLGELGEKYGWIDHAAWHGSWNLADFVFPFFLYIIGMAMAFSFAKYTSGERPTAAIYQRVVRRTLLLFGIGLLINGLVYSVCKMPVNGIFDLPNLRIMGVLQRISLAYGAAALIVLFFPRRIQWGIAGALLIGYWLVMAFGTAPDAPADVLTKSVDVTSIVDSKIHNMGAYIDRHIIPAAHFYKAGKKGYEPEGLFATLPAIVSVLLGYFHGIWLKQQRDVKTDNSVQMVMFGLAAIVAGSIWGKSFPINKNLWTSSYVMFMAGWALVVFAACYELVDVRQIGLKWSKPLEIMGLNALFAFVGSVLMIKVIYFNNIDGCGEKATTVYNFLRNALFGWSGEATSAVLLALLSVLLWMLICFGMYWRRWFIKL